MTERQPHVFISYSWTSESHQIFVKDIADRLISDGVQLTIDIYDLNEGDDKFSFMEKMVLDESITHVLMMCDQKYKDRADKRSAGVGTETQIISKEVYEKVTQSRFIPIICEKDNEGNAILPTYLSSRIYIDFSSPQKVNENWDQLLRSIYNQPLFQKPQLGKKPSYLDEDNTSPSSPLHFKLISLKNSISNNKTDKMLLRGEFLDLCLDFIDKQRVRKTDEQINIGETCVNVYNSLVPIRNLLVEWLDYEYKYDNNLNIFEVIQKLIEDVAKLRNRPVEISSWYEGTFDGHKIFLLDLIYYIIAILIKNNQFELIHQIITDKYYVNNTHGEFEYRDFYEFCYHSDSYNNPHIHKFLSSKKNMNYYSCIAELIKMNDTNNIISFHNIIEADLLIFLIVLTNGIRQWIPQFIYYMGYAKKVELFSRAEKKSYFHKIALATGVESNTKLKEKFLSGMSRLGIAQWGTMSRIDFSTIFNIDKLGTL